MQSDERAPRRQRLELAGADGVGAGWGELAERSAIAMFRRTDRPMNVTRRPVASAARIAWSMRSMFEANEVTIARAGAAP